MLQRLPNTESSAGLPVRCSWLGTAIGLLLTFGYPVLAEELFTESAVFVAGEGGYHTYRIPSIVQTTQGTLLAFCEGRRDSRSDAGNIDLLVKRSDDGGRQWSETVTVWDEGPHTCGNPCPVVDRRTGTIWLLMTWNAGDVSESGVQPGWGLDSRRVFVTHSTDDGATWQTPRDITRQVKPLTWTWYATGPGAGIQLQLGNAAGRLVIPCDHKVPESGSDRFYSHVIFSDDQGATWQLGGTSPQDHVNECEVVELLEGRLLLNMRNYDRTLRTRQVCVSDDGGITWRDQRHDPQLVAPTCQASIRRYRWPSSDEPGVILFSNPASSEDRRNLTVRASFDDARTWAAARTIHEGSAAYSCLVVLQDGTIGCLYEQDSYRRVALARFSLDWLAP